MLRIAVLSVLLGAIGCDSIGGTTKVEADHRSGGLGKGADEQGVSQGEADAKAKADAETKAAAAAEAAARAADIAAGRLSADGKPLIRLMVTADHGAIVIGVPVHMNAIGLYEDGSERDLTRLAAWATSEPTVLASGVDRRSGIFIGKAKGTAIITGSVGFFSGSTTVAVNEASLESLAITSIPLAKPAGGDGFQFIVEGTYTDGVVYDVTAVAAWASLDTTVAVVDNGTEKGFARSLRAGKATIQAIVDGKIATMPFQALEPEILSLHLDDDRSAALLNGCVTGSMMDSSSEGYRPLHFVGDVRFIAAFAYYSDCTYRWIDDGVVYTSSDPNVASFDDGDQMPYLYQHVAGSTDVKVKLGALESAARTYTVVPVVALALAFDPTELELPDYCYGPDEWGERVDSGDAHGLRLDVYVALSNCAIDHPTFAVTWSSSEPGIGRFDDAEVGYLTFVGDGDTTVTATPDPATGLAAISKVVSVQMPKHNGSVQRLEADDAFTLTVETVSGGHIVKTHTLTFGSSGDADEGMSLEDACRPSTCLRVTFTSPLATQLAGAAECAYQIKNTGRTSTIYADVKGVSWFGNCSGLGELIEITCPEAKDLRVGDCGL